jgi:hypothetical protein
MPRVTIRTSEGSSGIGANISLLIAIVISTGYFEPILAAFLSVHSARALLLLFGRCERWLLSSHTCHEPTASLLCSFWVWIQTLNKTLLLHSAQLTLTLVWLGGEHSKIKLLCSFCFQCWGSNPWPCTWWASAVL